ncbi:hypothetical protein GCM10008955_05810 [Deinococcus malanensis]|uniref:MarR family transcriptional regulator n=1 Tax=Deinococcus malanensis TaxID=1706855 RepID=A0ABQ2EKW0_9DEIO|nr:hypothetical protein [Deinococcus malanensis]GGK15265.1 hypothetical protein GCM10008955_05810 [Deinococcus malanensis]
MPSSSTGVSLERLAVRVLLRLQAEPATWTARSLARELGETANRVNRIVLAIEAETGVERSGPHGFLTVTGRAL